MLWKNVGSRKLINKFSLSSSKKNSGSTPVVVEAAKSNSNNGASGSGLYGFISDNCGSSGATHNDPNGSEWFLNCGLSNDDKNSKWVSIDLTR